MSASVVWVESIACVYCMCRFLWFCLLFFFFRLRAVFNTQFLGVICFPHFLYYCMRCVREHFRVERLASMRLQHSSHISTTYSMIQQSNGFNVIVSSHIFHTFAIDAKRHFNKVKMKKVVACLMRNGCVYTIIWRLNINAPFRLSTHIPTLHSMR